MKHKLTKKIVGIILLICMAAPATLSAASYWTGNGVYMADKQGEYWGVNVTYITKVSEPGPVYQIKDIDSYSAYVSNSPEHIGNSLEKSFTWHNHSRLAYVKLLAVTPGQQISFVFSDEFYVFCAEYNSSYQMVKDGDWYTTGGVLSLTNSTKWIMLVFREVNGDLQAGGGQETNISVADIKKSSLNYVVFRPFVYTFNCNGGNYNGSTDSFTRQRLGVQKMTLPTVKRDKYVFKGWKSADGTIYSGTLPIKFDEKIFKDTSFTAVWEPVIATSVTLDKSYVIMEENQAEKIKLVATVEPTNTLDKTISWKSDNTSVATVDASGNVSAKATGKATISATCGSGIAKCTVYVMGFDIELPSVCTLNQSYEIKINVYNNGTSALSGRKRVLLEAPQSISMYRVGDEATTCLVLAESSSVAGFGYKRLSQGSYLANTMDTSSIYYRLVPEKKIEKAGDYQGNIDFSVTVK